MIKVEHISYIYISYIYIYMYISTGFNHLVLTGGIQAFFSGNFSPLSWDVLLDFNYQTLVQTGFLNHQPSLGGGFKHFLFSSLFGEDSHFD